MTNGFFNGYPDQALDLGVMVVVVEALETKNNFGFLSSVPSEPFLTLAISSSSMAEAQTKATDKNIQFILNSCLGDRSS